MAVISLRRDCPPRMSLLQQRTSQTQKIITKYTNKENCKAWWSIFVGSILDNYFLKDRYHIIC